MSLRSAAIISECGFPSERLPEIGSDAVLRRRNLRAIGRGGGGQFLAPLALVPELLPDAMHAARNALFEMCNLVMLI